MPMLTDKQLQEKEPYASILQMLRQNQDGLKADKFLKHINIKDSDRLNKCLKVLIKKGWIETIGKPKYYRYMLTADFHTDRIIRTIKSEMERWYSDNILVDFVYDSEMKKDGFNNKPKIMVKDSSWELCGIPKEMRRGLSKKEKQHMNNLIQNVVKNLEELIRFKFSYLDIKTHEDFLDLIKNVSENDLFNVLNVGFYYLGNPLLNPEKYFDISKKN